MCIDHITDPCLSQRLEDFVTEHNCAVCGTARPSEKNASFAVPLEKLMYAVVETVRHFYADAEAVLPWDSEDGVLVGPQIDTWDVVEDIADGAFDNAYSDRIIELISSAIGYQTTWTSWFTASDTDGLDYAWEQFAQTAMHQSRMVVGMGSPTDPPARLARFLESVLLYATSDLGLVRQLPPGTGFYRGRLCENPDLLNRHSDDLGPAPPKKAAANRMSPAGVALFYASGDPQTAVAEIAGHGVEPLAVIGKFTNTRGLRILDLTSSPAPISPFCLEKREHARMGRFLSSFVRYIAAPVIPDGRQHVEYAPTQLLTEYLRWVPEPKLDGIALPSAQTENCTYVLFFSRSECATLGDPAAEYDVDDPFDGDVGAEPALALDPETVITYRVERQYSGVDAGPSHRARPPWASGDGERH
ncbi:HEPN-associated N-terminal domain-containing protein [Mycobacterium senriense]